MSATRPASIVRFERFYLAGLFLGLANHFIHWEYTVAMLDQPRLQAVGIGPEALFLSIAVGLAVGLLLWWLIARRGSRVAMVIALILAALGLFGLIADASDMPVKAASMLVIQALALVLQLYALFQLFRPDAKAWLAAR